MVAALFLSIQFQLSLYQLTTSLPIAGGLSLVCYVQFSSLDFSHNCVDICIIQPTVIFPFITVHFLLITYST